MAEAIPSDRDREIERHGRLARMMRTLATGLVLMIFAVAGNEILSGREDTYANARREIETVNLALAHQSEQLLLAVDLAIDATRGELQRLDAAARSNGQLVHRLLAAHVAAVPAVTNMGFINAEGWLIAHSAVSAPPGSRFDDRHYFRVLSEQTTDQLIIDEPTIGRISNKRLVFVARRVADPEGRFLGVVVASIETRWLSGMLRSLVTFDGGTAAIFRSDAQLLARFPEAPEAWNLSFERTQLFDHHAKVSPSGSFRSVSPIDGRERIISYRVLDRYPILVDVSVDESRLLSRWRASTLRIGASALIAAFLVIALFVIIRRQLRQLEVQSRALRRQVHTDSLTGLPNRLLFEDRLERALAAALRKERPLAVLFIDLDKFKEVNDSLGHAAGDTLLQETAVRLAACMRDMDTVSRLGGDEFTVLLPEMDNAADAEKVAQKIVRAIALPFNICGRAITVTCSVGIAVFPDDADDAGTLVRHADFAMYTAKQAGHNCFRRYRPSAQGNSLPPA